MHVLIGVARFELTASSAQVKRPTKLSYTPSFTADYCELAICEGDSFNFSFSDTSQ